MRFSMRFSSHNTSTSVRSLMRRFPDAGAGSREPGLGRECVSPAKAGWPVGLPLPSAIDAAFGPAPLEEIRRISG